MNIHLRIDCTNATHTHCTIFLDAVYCGSMCVTNEKFDRFADVLADGINTNADPPDSFERTGNTWNEVKQIRKILIEGNNSGHPSTN